MEHMLLDTGDLHANVESQNEQKTHQANGRDETSHPDGNNRKDDQVVEVDFPCVLLLEPSNTTITYAGARGGRVWSVPPALCVGQLAAAVGARAGSEQLDAGDLPFLDDQLVRGKALDNEDPGQDARRQNPDRQTELVVHVVEGIIDGFKDHHDYETHAQDPDHRRLDLVDHHPAHHEPVKNRVRQQAADKTPQGRQKEFRCTDRGDAAVGVFDQPVPLTQNHNKVFQNEIDGYVSANGDDDVLFDAEPIQAVLLQPTLLLVETLHGPGGGPKQ